MQVDVRDHEKLCGEPIECKCGLKFAFKCNLVAHKKAHPACQDHQTNSNSSDDSEQNMISRSSQRAGSKRARDDSTTQLGLPIPLPDFKGVPEVPPEFKLARHDFPLELSNTSWASNMVYPTIPTISFTNLPVYTKLQDRFQFNHQPHSWISGTKQLQAPSFEAVNCVMGAAFNHSLPFKARSG